MKITVSVTKSSHQDHGQCYLHLPIVFSYMHSPVLLENKKVVEIAVFQIDDRSLFSCIYYEFNLVSV